MNSKLNKMIKEASDDVVDKGTDDSKEKSSDIKQKLVSFTIVSSDKDSVENSINDVKNYITPTGGDRSISLYKKFQQTEGGDSNLMTVQPTGNQAAPNQIVKWTLQNVWSKLSDKQKITKLNQVVSAYSKSNVDAINGFKNIIKAFPDTPKNLTTDDKVLKYIASLPNDSSILLKLGGPMFKKGYFYPIQTKETQGRATLRKGIEYSVDKESDGYKFEFPIETNPFETPKEYRVLLNQITKASGGNAKVYDVTVDIVPGISAKSSTSKDKTSKTSDVQKSLTKVNFKKQFPTPALAEKFKKQIPKEFKIEVNKDTVNVLDITDSQKKNLMLQAVKFINDNPVKPVKEPKVKSLKEIIKESLSLYSSSSKTAKKCDCGCNDKCDKNVKVVDDNVSSPLKITNEQQYNQLKEYVINNGMIIANLSKSSGKKITWNPTKNSNQWNNFKNWIHENK